MEGKIKVLFHTLDQAGVSYFRSQTPATELERNHSDEFYVEINPQLNLDDPNIIDYLKTFHIIHYHRMLLPDTRKMISLANELRKSGTILMVDIDDYWNLHKKHPFYGMNIQNKAHIPILDNLKIADYVTTTTELFADEIRKVTNKDNVGVFYNSVDPIWMKQFQNNWKPDPNGKVRITYAGGSSHAADVEQLEGVFNVLANDSDLKDKFTITLVGFDCEGHTTDVTFNQEFATTLQKRGLWSTDMVKEINKSMGDIDKIAKIPADIKEKFRNNIFKHNQRDIRSEESVYYTYEKIFTDNYSIIDNKEYVRWLMNFERNVTYENEGIYKRRWTQKANTYAKALDETDIVLAPLDNNTFNIMKSELKQTECWTRKLPVVCSDMPPYNVHGRHMENCILIPTEKNARKYWQKYLKRLILDADLRKQLGEQLYNDFCVEFNLETVTKKRAEFYKAAIAKTLDVSK